LLDNLVLPSIANGNARTREDIESSLTAPTALSRFFYRFADDDPRSTLFPPIIECIFDHLLYRDLLTCASVCRCYEWALFETDNLGHHTFFRAIHKPPFAPAKSEKGVPIMELEEMLQIKWKNCLNSWEMCRNPTCMERRPHKMVHDKFVNPLFIALALTQINSVTGYPYTWKICLKVEARVASLLVLDAAHIPGLLDLHASTPSTAIWRKMFLTNLPVK
jgi:hypothetical protein